MTTTTHSHKAWTDEGGHVKLSQLDPAIVSRKFASKRQEEVFERELMTMLTQVYVENFEPLWAQNGPFAHILP